MFQLILRPIDEITPFGSPDHYNLSWFGLTDGWYWIDVGQEQLFRYSDAALMAQDRDDSVGAPLRQLPYVDYYVARLWEDLLDILPDILEPVPPHIASIIRDAESWRLWQAAAERAVAVESTPDASEAWELFDGALSWWWRRHLSTSHLQAGPGIWLWSDGSSVRIEWHNHGGEHDGEPTWETMGGHFDLALDAFMDEVTSFDERLMHEMANRVAEATSTWHRLDVSLDPQLVEEHSKRSHAVPDLLDSMSQRQPTDWNAVIEAIGAIEAMPSFTRSAFDLPPSRTGA